MLAYHLYLFTYPWKAIFTRFRKIEFKLPETIASYNTFLYLCTSNRKQASLVPDFGRHRRQTLVLINDRRRSSMMTKIRARNGVLRKLKYQQNIHYFVWACYDGIGYILNIKSHVSHKLLDYIDFDGWSILFIIEKK